MALPHNEWLAKQPLHTQMWLKKQAIWYDVDMAKAFVAGAIIGAIVAWIL
jgi:hypothetical protein